MPAKKLIKKPTIAVPLFMILSQGSESTLETKIEAERYLLPMMSQTEIRGAPRRIALRRAGRVSAAHGA
jgi:hypothetical protein